MRKSSTLLTVLCACIFACAFSACKADGVTSSNSIEEGGSSTAESSSVSSEESPSTSEGHHVHTHAFGEWVETLAPTFDADGSKKRECACGEEETEAIPKVAVAYTITVVDGDSTTTVRVAADGAYTLPPSNTPDGYVFIGWYDENDAPYGQSGVIGANVTLTAKYKTQVTTFAQLKALIEKGESEINITADIELTDTIYVVSKTTLFAKGDYTLKRAANFLGDLFIIGQTAQGDNVVMEGEEVELHLRADDGATLTFDGNKAEVSGDVAGSAFLVMNSAQAYMYEGVRIVNHKKVANAFLSEGNEHNVSDYQKAGGAAILIINGAFHMYDGVISGCEVQTGDSDCSRGGAVFNYGTFKMYDGVIENCQAGRGGAIYNYRITYVYSGEIKDNYAGVYAGAMFVHNSQYAYAVLGEEGTEIKLSVSGNTSNKSGGAIFIPQQATVYVQGGTEFKQNVVQGGNGGAMNVAGALVVDYAVFTENTATSKGGAIYGYYNDPDYVVRIIQLKNGEFKNNAAPRGGAVAFGKGDDVETGARVEIGDVLFEANTANYDASDKYGFGGAVHVDDASIVTITGSPVFKKNVAAENGGAVYLTKQSQFIANIPQGQTLTFTENSVTNGNGGAVYNSNSKLKLYAITGNNIVLEENVAADNGGAIAVHSAGMVELYAVIFDANKAAEDGGAMYAYGGNAIIGDVNNQAASVFKNNTSKRGGALFMSTTKSGSTDVDIYALTAMNNTTTSGGGAIYVAEHEDAAEDLTATLDVAVLTLQGNSAGGNGGAMYIYTSAVVNIGTIIATNNSADGKYGGVVYISGAATCTIDYITASGNSASMGGCMYLTTTNSALTLKGGDITGNTATKADSGNAIWVNTSKAILTVKAGVTYTDGEIQGKSGFSILTQ